MSFRGFRHRAVAAAAAVVLTMPAACGTGGAAGESSTVTVLAAASLTESFGALEKEFERAHPGTTIEIGYGSSSALAVQLQNGAEADVLATADAETMDRVRSADLVADQRDFASNTLQITVPAGNPRGIGSLSDLLEPGVVVAMAAPAVPAGRVAREVFGKAGVAVPSASQEPDVRSVLNRVVLGEADAGLVWATDVRASREKVQGIPIPVEFGGATKYPIANTKHARNATTGARFVEFVLAEHGQRILREHGFGPAW